MSQNDSGAEQAIRYGEAVALLELCYRAGLIHEGSQWTRSQLAADLVDFLRPEGVLTARTFRHVAAGAKQT